MRIDRSIRKLLPICVAIAIGGCGGSGGGDLDRAGPTVGSVPYALTRAEPDLDITDPALALLAALGTAALSVELDSNDFRDVDDFGGTGITNCDAGQLAVNITGSSATGPLFLVEAAQCYLGDAEVEVALDGRFRIAENETASFVDAVFGAGGNSFVGAVREASDPLWNFGQVIGTARVGNIDRSLRSSETSDIRTVSGVGPQADPLRPTSFVELFASDLEFPFAAFVNPDSGTSLVGRLSIRGVGLDDPCNTRGKFFASNNGAPLVFDTSVDEARAIGGTLSLSTLNASATVTFAANGGAEVTTASGTTSFSPEQVESHCGIQG